MQSPQIPNVLLALSRGDYVLPASVAADPEAGAIYRKAFAGQTALARELNACSRAQWEIRGIARRMLALLNESATEIFGGYGPSCAVTGTCPEGKMSCGNPVQVENGVWRSAADQLEGE